MRSADHAVRRAVVHRDAIPIDYMPIREDDLAEEALQFVRSCRLHDWRLRTCQHPPGLFEVKQQRAKAIAILFGRAVINLQPAFRGPDRCGARSDPSAVPAPLAAVRKTTMPAPMNQVGRLGQPDIVAAQLRTAGTVQRIILAAYLFVEDCAILVVWGEDHANMIEVLPVARRS